MTVFIRNKNTGNVGRYPLIGNVGFENGRIVLTKDPGVSATVYKIPAEDNEIIRVTEGELETPESVKAWRDEDIYIASYIETVFGEV